MKLRKNGCGRTANTTYSAEGSDTATRQCQQHITNSRLKHIRQDPQRRQDVYKRQMQQFAKLAQEARHAEDRESVFAKTGLAAGFANGILRAGLITKDELAQLVDMLNKAGSDRLAELDAKRKSVFHRIFKGAVL